MRLQDAVHEVAAPAAHVHHARELGERAVLHHRRAADGVDRGHRAPKLVLLRGVRLELGPDPALVLREGILREGEIPRDRSLGQVGPRREEVGELAPRGVGILGVMAYQSTDAVRVVDAQHGREGGVDEPRTRNQLEHAIRGARVHDALDIHGVAADLGRNFRRRKGPGGEQVGDLELLRDVDEDGLVVRHRHFQHLDRRRRERVRGRTESAGEHVEADENGPLRTTAHDTGIDYLLNREWQWGERAAHAPAAVPTNPTGVPPRCEASCSRHPSAPPPPRPRRR